MKNAIFCIDMDDDVQNLKCKLRNWEIELEFLDDFDLFYAGVNIVTEDNDDIQIRNLDVPISSWDIMMAKSIKKLENFGYDKITFVDIDCSIADVFNFRNMISCQNSFATGTSKRSGKKNIAVCTMNNAVKRKKFIEDFSVSGKWNFDLFDNGNFFVEKSRNH